MTFNTIAAGAVVFFVIAMIFLAVKYKNATLDKAAMLPGESVLFEDHDGRFADLPIKHGAVNTLYYRKAVVRITNHRLLIAQSAPGSSTVARIQFAIYHDPESIPMGFGERFKDGYMSFVAGPSQMQFVTEANKRMLKIASNIPPDYSNLYPVYILIDSPNLDQYVKALKIRN
ncbi:MAG: hypothetical protein HY077_14465 [Elusimicrobia bacterium]|nr:hypothetical protein [Elusimicrobiota bacterium]